MSMDAGSQKKTTVVNIKTEPYQIYIGRACYGHNASPFANKFKIGWDGTRSQVLAKYRKWILGRPDLIALLPDLKGKTLGCWCKPKPCHGDILVELLETFT